MFKLAVTALMLFACASTAMSSKNRVLVLLESPAMKQTHSVFLKSLEDRGFEVTLKRADDANLNLIKLGEFVYDHLIVFAPGVQGKFLNPSV